MGITVGPDGALWFTNSYFRAPSIGRITTTGSVSVPLTNPENITSGPDCALWLTGSVNGGATPAFGRMTTAGSVTAYSDPRLIPEEITAGPDGAMWSTNFNSIARISTADSVVTSPDQGPSGTTEAVTGAGHSAGETVVVKYLTGLTSPASVPLCTTTAAADGTFICLATIPATAGHRGTHTITAHGITSKTVTETSYLLTAA